MHSTSAMLRCKISPSQNSIPTWRWSTMGYTVNKVEMWNGEIDDRVGGLAQKLDTLADAGADLEVVVARRQPHMPGKGIALVGPVAGAKAKAAATAAGLSPASALVALRVDGPNKPGE